MIQSDLFSPSWESLDLRKGHNTFPKKVKHCQVNIVSWNCWYQSIHPGKTNIDTKNDGLEDASPASNMASLGIYVSFRVVVYQLYISYP